METIRTQLLRIQQQLSGLSASQKMLTASLVAIMVMTLIWWARYAGTAELEPVLDQPLPAQEMGQIQQALQSRGINARIVADRVMVSAERKMEAVAALAYSNALPSNITAAWDQMVKQMSPWDSRAKTELIHNQMKERMLSGVITDFFPGVARANVIINPVSERRIGGSLEPSASVQITTRGNVENLKRLVDAAAATVASAVPGLAKSRVSVVVDGRPMRSQDASSSFAGAELFEQIEQQERRISEKIASLLTPGALVAVTVDVQTVSSVETRETYDAKNTFTKEQTLESETQETTEPAPTVSEPGAVSNMGLSLPGAAIVSGATSTSEKTRTENAIFPSKSTETINKPAGKATVASAAVRLPRSYFVAKYKAANPNQQKEPDDAALQPIVTAELSSVRKTIQDAVGMQSDANLTVDMYYDTTIPLLAATEQAQSSGGVGRMVNSYAREIAVGALAIISLFMVSMIVKKGAPTPAITVTPQPDLPPQLQAGEEIAGVVGDGKISLDAVELDEDAVHAQQMVEQVSTMVKENPEAAANLVKRWLNRS